MLVLESLMEEAVSGTEEENAEYPFSLALQLHTHGELVVGETQVLGVSSGSRTSGTQIPPGTLEPMLGMP